MVGIEKLRVGKQATAAGSYGSFVILHVIIVEMFLYVLRPCLKANV